ncbi:MAG: PmoA family protein [Planctomycetes bacterium]|nr:PmoA family protein [Planctomycetota bacterium]
MAHRMIPGLWALLAAPCVFSFDAIRLEVSAGPHGRRGTPVRWDVPQGQKLPSPFRLVEAEGGAEVPVQLEAGPPRAVVWILEGLAAGSKRRYRIEPGEPKAAAPAAGVVAAREALTLRAAGKDVLRYNAAEVQPPAGVEPIYARSGYIHPLWTPGGRLITNDFPLNHKHHHGVWMPWSQTELEGRAINFWEQNRAEGKVQHVSSEPVSGPVAAGFKARHRFTDLKAAGGPKPVLDETWEVTVYGLEKPFVADFVSVQRCAGSTPLKLKQYRYGGFGFRGSADWEGKDGCEFLTSEGKTRADGHATAARWCAVWGKVKGETAGISFFCHPSNFRHPQNMRIHDTEPFFNFAPCQTGDFEITPEKPLVSRYRLVIQDGKPDPGEVERLWRDYAEPPKVEVVAAKGGTAGGRP